MKRNYIMKSFALASIVLGAFGMQAQTTFNYTGSLQTYTVPAGVSSIMIESTGAAGGVGTTANIGVAGQGAKMVGDFIVTPGQVLKVLVGEEGETADHVGGGGGGSFVWDSVATTLFIAAGGGGGGGKTDNSNMAIVDGLDAVTTNDGVNGNGTTNGAGIGGNGGSQPTTAINWASGGAGWNTDGGDGSIHGCSQNSTGGQKALSGGAGGTGGGTIGSTAADGGYGGGGGSNARCGAVGAGGGGGYSGGGAGGEVVSGDYSGAGGGGSFNGGTNQTNTTGVGTGNGIVIITAICSLDTSTTVAGFDITSNQAGGTYQWINCSGNTAIAGATNATYTATSNGDYAVIVTMGVCSDTSSCVNISTVGLSNAELMVRNVALYPNPTTNNVTINLGAMKNAQISIVTVTGKEVYNLNNVTKKQVNVSLAEFSKGIYFVKVKSNNEQKVIKLIKE